MNSANNEVIEFWGVRHGQTEENLRGVIQGQGTGVMTMTGLRQMMLAGEKLYRVPFDAIYASDLPRAMESAWIIQAAGHEKLDVQPLRELREWHLGVLEGLTREECAERYPEVWDGVCQASTNVEIPEGESRPSLFKRIHDCLAALVAKHQPGQRILLVTHGGPLRMILRMIVGGLHGENCDGAVANGAICRFRYHVAKQSWQLISWNITEHME